MARTWSPLAALFLAVVVAALALASYGLKNADRVEEVADASDTQALAGQGYLNWLRHSAKIHGGSQKAAKDFMDVDAPSKNMDWGKMNAAGKVLVKIRRNIGRERAAISRLEKLMKNRMGKKKQPEALRVNVGSIGVRGARGPYGKRGHRGARGPRGPRGVTGPKGDLGRTGPRGPRGRKGLQGPKGRRGRAGPTGRTGNRGEPGPTGPQGREGSRGYRGNAGRQGRQGRNGMQGGGGPAGAPGYRGHTGTRGPPGVPGKILKPPPPPPPRYHLRGQIRNSVSGAIWRRGVTVSAVSMSGVTVSSTNTGSGVYDLPRLTPGRWKIRVRGSGICNFEDQIVLGRGDARFNINVSPSLGGNQARMVLTWGASPRDLDSHMRSPNGCVTYYGRRHGCSGVSLDRDVTNGFGPETVTIHVRRPGIYHFRVHNYSRRSHNLMSRGLANQRARVTFYVGCRRHVFICGRDGNVNPRTHYWNVFTFNGATGQVRRWH